MRRRFWFRAFAITALLGNVCAQLDSLPPCGITCVNNVIAKGFGCASGDNACLCKQQDFVFGVRDCASQSCAADVAPKVNEYVAGLCATATQAPPASTPPASNPPPSTPAAQQTTPPVVLPSTSQPPPSPSSLSEPPKPSAAETPASSEVAKTAPSETSRNTVTDTAQAFQPSTAVSTTLATSTRSLSSTSSRSTSTSTGARPSQSGSASENGTGNLESDAAGLSSSAKIGIGVGAGVGVLAIALALWLLIRRPKNRAKSMQISGPMPGSGRDYTGGFIGMKDKNHSELEMKSRRYEDMLPRQSPRRFE
ncbi:hypothetical protein HER10_EVM0002622 [Colletotrichum scovillei]|uniref:Cfem domain protein n=1 Tax=Colletotrichum scovillei TaxID=1209932 RepID=A0A9P7QZD0_9PEZI|nr:uncharacterized protein HER10_EVM0002622 [Colletotrichum scovillei]KAF4778288.1 hypothetical protein HER10_EVM0002622 [Colletotrichum scovillei]KAG7043821.1 cfem domain protein [Colletotrichum scovillei]KAG7045923.1 cfem domain protein [Colletotrichum scovillei]KAG7063271.1 cfem domain protein [Colletotrichum scovillei]